MSSLPLEWYVKDQGPEPGTMGLPQMIPICRSFQTFGRGASHKDNQQKFLSMMGILKTMELNSEQIIDDLTATLWATALNHEDMYGEETLTPDPFYTPEQWKSKTDSLLKMLEISVSDIKLLTKKIMN